MTPMGRPEVGAPINVRLGDELLAQVDAYAAEHGIKRAEAIRQIVQAGLRAHRRRKQ
ncbi:ribbon-helix-helix domain-containing protein [Mycobacterium intracellulare]|uniref:ribbon-helix-helix domain-containing protein n=1 Tax=Mycobacterium intracellulare TaxID=1767 RepID=UPI001B34D034|nr:ribbon-helix-helix domain-containing protein [Mycobacterium intracellulare]